MVTSLADILLDAVRAHPEAVALVDGTRQLTYRQLTRRVSGAVRVLDERGVRPGDRVVVVTDNTVPSAIWVWAVLWAGAIVVPAHHGLKPFQLRQIVDDCDPTLIVADDAASGAPAHPLSMPEDAAPRDITAAGVAMLVYTSGSTGTPKGVVCPHASCLFALSGIGDRLGYAQTDRVLTALPLSFDYGLYQLFLGAQVSGTVVLATPGDVFGAVRLLDEQEITVVPVVPALADLLIMALRRKRRSVSSVRLVTSTGAGLPAGTADGLRGVFDAASIVPMYGITECKRVSIGAPDEDLARPGSSGLPLDDTAVVVRDDGGEAVRSGVVGEITVSGKNVMDGYWNTTSDRFRTCPDGNWLYTGDRGSIDADGRVHVLGRADEIFKRSGVRTSTGEVEAAALDIGGVGAAVALRPDGEFDLDIVVQSVRLGPAEVIEQLRDRLETAKVPARCAVLKTIPLTANGKVDRARICRGRTAGTLRWER